MSATVLTLGAGCVLASMITEVKADGDTLVDHHRIEVLAREGCRQVDLMLPPGVTLTRWKAKVKLGDGGGHRLETTRAEWLPRGLDGVGRLRLHVPELLGGDRVKLRLERRHTVGHVDWAPGELGARFAEIDVNGLPAVAVGLSSDRDGYWANDPGPGAVVRVGSAGSPAAADRPDLGSELTPAEALAAQGDLRLLPARADLVGQPIAERLLAAGAVSTTASAHALATAAGLPLADVVDPARPARPVGVAAVAPGEPPRVWAHPDRPWDADWVLHLPDADGTVQPVGAPAGAELAAEDEVHVSRVLHLELPDGADPRKALVPGQGSRVTVHDVLSFDDAGKLPRLALRAPAVGPTDAPGRLTVSDLPDGASSVVWLPPTGDQALVVQAPRERLRVELTSEADDAPTCGRWPEGIDETEIEARGADVRTDETGWWIHAWDEVPLAAERARVIAGLYGRFNRRALPEPGLPLRLRSRLRGWDLAAELPDTLRQRAVVAELPGQPALWPRKLYRARKSGVVTPIEAALIVRAYALQARMDAEWVLVRSLRAAPGPELCASTYDAMLVRLRFEGEERWLDPACDGCAPFEIRPELLGRPALGPAAERTPEPVAGRWVVRRDDARTITWELEGPAALELRRWLRSLPVEGRSDALAARMAGAGATLRSVSGVKERGTPITATATATSAEAVPDPADVVVPGLDEVVTWEGTRLLQEGVDGPAVRVDLDRGTWADPSTWQAAREQARWPTTGLQPFTER